MATKIIITRKSDDVITNIVDTATTVENGLLVKDNAMGEYIIGFIAECNIYNNVETDTTIIPQKYKYTATGGFVVDPNYKPYVSTEEQIASLQSQLLEAQSAINTLLGV